MSLMINYQRNCEEVYIFVIVNEKNKIYFQINFWGKSNLCIRVTIFARFQCFLKRENFLLYSIYLIASMIIGR